MSATRTLLQGIKDLLAARRLTYRDLARKIGVSENTIKRDLSRGRLSLARLDQICDALEITLTDLMQFFLKRFVPEYFQSAFEGPGDAFRFVGGIPLQERDGCSAILALRSWEFSEFTRLRRVRAP